MATCKLGFITKFPVDFFFTLENAAKKWDKAPSGAEVSSPRARARPTTRARSRRSRVMVAQGVKGIAITPTSPAVAPALDKAIEQGVKVVLHGQRHPRLERQVVRRRDRTTSRAACSPGKYLATKLKAGDTLGVLEGVPGVPALDARVNGMLAGLGALKSQLEVVGKLRDRLRAGQGRLRRPQTS